MRSQEENLTFHLEALRTILIKILTAFGIVLVPMLFVAPDTTDFLIRIIRGQQALVLNYFSPMEVFLLHLKVAAVLDFLVCFPYAAYLVWQFLLPALYKHERSFIRSLVLISSLLFICGMIFALFVISPLLINFGLSFARPEIKAVFGISDVVSLVIKLSLIFGIMFQFPLITYSLIRADIVSYQSVRHLRPYIFVGILIIAGILTPPDIISQLMLCLPTYALFEISLLAAGKKS